MEGIINMDLKLLKEIVFDKNLTGYELSIYCILLSMMQPDDSIVYVHTELIEMQIVNSITIPKRLSTSIKESLESLIDKLSIKIVDVSSNKKKYILDCKNLYVKTEDPYIVLSKQQFRKILSIEKVNNFILLRYYIDLIEIINSYNNDKENKGNISIQKIIDVTQLNSKTIFEYNRILENNDLLFVDQKNYIFLSKNNKEKFYRKNIYNLNKENINSNDIRCFDSNINGEYNYQNCTCINAKRNFSNYKRKMSQMYNQIINGNIDKYTSLEINEVYQYIMSENQKYIRMYEKDKNINHLSKIRSVECFENLFDD